MTDLIEKLRSYNPTSGYSRVMREAADHITCLGVELSQRAEDIHELQQELAASKANDMYAMRLLAEGQAREKVLLSELERIRNGELS